MRLSSLKFADFHNTTSSRPGDAFRGCTPADASPETIRLRDSLNSANGEHSVDEDSLVAAAKTQDERSYGRVLLEAVMGDRPWEDHCGASAVAQEKLVNVGDIEKGYQHLAQECMHIIPERRRQFISAQVALLNEVELLARSDEEEEDAKENMNDDFSPATSSDEQLNLYESINAALQ